MLLTRAHPTKDPDEILNVSQQTWFEKGRHCKFMNLIPEPFIFQTGVRWDELSAVAWSRVNKNLILFHLKTPVDSFCCHIWPHHTGFLNMLYNRWLQPLSSIAYALKTPSVIVGLLFYTIWDLLKAFGYVSAIRNSTTSNFFSADVPSVSRWHKIYTTFFTPREDTAEAW